MFWFLHISWSQKNNVALLFDIFFILIYFNNHLPPPPTLSKYTKIQDCNLIIWSANTLYYIELERFRLFIKHDDAHFMENMKQVAMIFMLILLPLDLNVFLIKLLCMKIIVFQNWYPYNKLSSLIGWWIARRRIRTFCCF